jgi:hypothetical protein
MVILASRADDLPIITWDDVTSVFGDSAGLALSLFVAGGIAVLIICAVVQNKGGGGKPAVTKCSVCGGYIVRKYFIWGSDMMCPRCNGRMKNKVSKDAFKNRFG